MGLTPSQMISRRKVTTVAATPTTPVRVVLIPTQTAQTYSIPAGVTSVSIELVGQWPGAIIPPPITALSILGGNPGRVQGTWTISGAGTTVAYIYYPGGAGGIASNGSAPINGPVGGGAPAIFDGGTSGTLIAMAGGGGGGGRSIWNTPGQNGEGGGLIGGTGGGNPGQGGGGGTQSAPGAGGIPLDPPADQPGIQGLGFGVHHQGGVGGSAAGPQNPTSIGQPNGADGGGGGGAGWYGGGGGSGGYYFTAGSARTDVQGGGGGGSSYTDPTVVTNVTHTQGYIGPNGVAGSTGFNSTTIHFGGNYIILNYLM